MGCEERNQRGYQGDYLEVSVVVLRQDVRIWLIERVGKLQSGQLGGKRFSKRYEWVNLE